MTTTSGEGMLANLERFELEGVSKRTIRRARALAEAGNVENRMNAEGQWEVQIGLAAPTPVRYEPRHKDGPALVCSCPYVSTTAWKVGCVHQVAVLAHLGVLG